MLNKYNFKIIIKFKTSLISYPKFQEFKNYYDSNIYHRITYSSVIYIINFNSLLKWFFHKKKCLFMTQSSLYELQINNPLHAYEYY